MAKKMGELAFLGGVAIAILAALPVTREYLNNVQLLLVVLGLIVGYLNVTSKETSDFLIAAVALLAAASAKGTLDVLPWVGQFLGTVVANIAVFVAPAAVFVALKGVYALAKD